MEIGGFMKMTLLDFPGRVAATIFCSGCNFLCPFCHNAFLVTEREKAEILQKIGNAKYTIQRSKGLGENEADMMSLTTMNPETRRLIKVEPTDAQRTSEMFDLLLGDNLAGRKEHIAKYGHMYTDLADIS